MTVKYFATIRSYTGETARRIDGAPSDLRELLTQLAQRYGAPFRRAVFADGEDGRLHDQIIILVNGRNVRHLQQLDTPLAPDDEVSIFPMVAGG
jgi:molybdopterin synthase sulfur carrier subunit